MKAIFSNSAKEQIYNLNKEKDRILLKLEETLDAEEVDYLCEILEEIEDELAELTDKYE